MPPHDPAYFMAALLYVTIITFAVLGGADFGAGIWDLLARGRTAQQQRAALIRAIGPIWEANEIWLIFLVTGTFTAFPLVFSSVMTALFIPLTIGLIGIAMRGAAFAFYTHFLVALPHISDSWGRAFSVASTVTPFLFGCVAAAAASGHIAVGPGDAITANVITTWTTPFALACGCFAVALCATLAATFMAVEARNQGELMLLLLFRQRALISGAVAALLGAVAGWLASFDAPYLFGGLITRALPIALVAVAVGILTALALLLGFYQSARLLIGGMVALILGAWAVAQLPYLIVPDVTILRAAAPPGVEVAMLIATVVSMLIVLPSTYYLLYLFKAERRRRPGTTANDMIHSIEIQREVEAAALAKADGTLGEASAVARARRGEGAARWARRGLALAALPVVAASARLLWRGVRRTRERTRD